MPEPSLIPPARRVFCNRTLNLRSLRAIGYDMDYTLIHYRVDEWERRVYRHVQQKLVAKGWPVADLVFDPDLVIRGLVLDLELGNMIKADRFGYVRVAAHGTTFLTFDEQREVYGRITIDLAEPRYVFLNTLFSLSEACIYLQLVDLLDRGGLPRVLGYQDLHRHVQRSINATHVEGELKAEIISAPDQFVELDPETPLALLDQRDAGRKLLLITNSEWPYTRAIMEYAFDPFLPEGTSWRDLFALIIVSARKPAFFTASNPLFRVVNEEGLLTPAPLGFEVDGIYLGGNASMVEAHLGVSGDEILYVGDHMFTDVHVSKSVLRWRTGLVIRELEDDLTAIEDFATRQSELTRLMEEKEQLERQVSAARLALLRNRRAAPGDPRATDDADRIEALRMELRKLDQRIGPLAMASSHMANRHWGPLMRAGNDKSHLARQVEKYADVYMSRVSNFVHTTPYAYLRSPRGSLPHDRS